MYTEGYLKGYRDVKNDKTSYSGQVDTAELTEAIQLLQRQES